MKAIKLKSDSGFILIEVLMVLLIISLMLPSKTFQFQRVDLDYENSIILNQLEAMATRKSILIDTEVCPYRDCWFNARGNVNKAKTMILNRKGIQYELVIWLGFGRFEIKERVSVD